MSATTIAVAPLMKLYENLNENCRDQTTLISLLNSKMIKLELDLKEMTSEVLLTRRGNDISLTALKEALRTNSEDKKLLAEVTRQALMLLQKERAGKSELNQNRITNNKETPTSTESNAEQSETLEKSRTNKHPMEKKIEAEKKNSQQNCCYDKDLIISSEESDCGVENARVEELVKKIRPTIPTAIKKISEKEDVSGKTQNEREEDKEQALSRIDPTLAQDINDGHQEIILPLQQQKRMMASEQPATKEKKRIEESKNVVGKVQSETQLEDNNQQIESIVELVSDEENCDVEELLNISTYSSSEVDKHKEENRAESNQETDIHTGQGEHEIEVNLPKVSIKEQEKEREEKMTGKSVISWPETPKKTLSVNKKPEKRVEEPQIFLTLEEKRKKSMLKLKTKLMNREELQGSAEDKQVNNKSGVETQKVL
ncbi:calponin homology domain-containing protein DDB_G0272472-like [Ambystoma mexicanum]|uniref:calponin homology domain-containing protein DDB_G0272472-like n=1 Tax=Ambystoma mexicanum TaxID=8296 RepID=UPI0037E92961